MLDSHLRAMVRDSRGTMTTARRLACLRSVKPDEFGVLVDWLLKGDPFGRKAGRKHCHMFGHNRGSLAVCPECGAERIDPI